MMPPENAAQPTRHLNLKTFTRIAAMISFLIFLLTAFRAGWTRQETDFPNYYTAAVLLREGKPLRDFYDWTWFQRQMNYAGVEQLGSYTGQTPLTMLPIVPFASLPVQSAKRVWLLCNLAFLWLTIWLLSRVTRFSVEQIWLLAFCGYFSLYKNFSYGQYYVFLLLLLTACFYFLDQQRHILSGVGAGLAFALKLYGGPFLLLFLAKRKWKAAAAMSITAAILALLALKLFGWPDLRFYLTQVLPRSLDGNAIDPYAPAASAIPNMLRHLLMREPEWNPHPLWNSPPLFFFLHSFVTLASAAVAVLALAIRPGSDRRDFAWFVVATLLLSTTTGSYTFIVLLLPLVLLLEESRSWQSAFYFACYVLLTLPLRLAWLFPKIWLLVLMFVVIRWGEWNWLRRPLTAVVAGILVLVALADSKIRLAAYADEPPQRFDRIAVRPGTGSSSYPVVTRAGLFYQSLGGDGYVLRWLHDGRDEELSFDGDAFQPFASGPDDGIDFELVAHGKSTMMHFNPLTRAVTQSSDRVSTKDRTLAMSPDGRWLAYVSTASGAKAIFLRNLTTGTEEVLAGGNCNSWSPAWQLDSKAVIFASDCERGMDLAALYRAPVPTNLPRFDAGRGAGASLPDSIFLTAAFGRPWECGSLLPLLTRPGERGNKCMPKPAASPSAGPLRQQHSFRGSTSGAATSI